jgi:hypothetical protein
MRRCRCLKSRGIVQTSVVEATDRHPVHRYHPRGKLLAQTQRPFPLFIDEFWRQLRVPIVPMDAMV